MKKSESIVDNAKARKELRKKYKREIKEADEEIAELEGIVDEDEAQLKYYAADKRAQMLLENSEPMKRFKKDMKKKLEAITLAQAARAKDMSDFDRFHYEGLEAYHEDEDDDYYFLYDIEAIIESVIYELTPLVYKCVERTLKKNFSKIKDDKVAKELEEVLFDDGYLEICSDCFEGAIKNSSSDFIGLRKGLEDVIKDYISVFLIAAFDKFSIGPGNSSEIRSDKQADDYIKERDNARVRLGNRKYKKKEEKEAEEKQIADFMENVIPKR